MSGSEQLEPELPDPFKSAKRMSGVIVRLSPDDLVNAWPSLSRESAERLLESYGGTIAGEMLSAGLTAAMRFIRHEEMRP